MQLLDDPSDREHAIETGLAADPDVDTRGLLLLSKASILRQRGRHDEAVLILNALLGDPAPSLLVQAWAKEMLAHADLTAWGLSLLSRCSDTGP